MARNEAHQTRRKVGAMPRNEEPQQRRKAVAVARNVKPVEPRRKVLTRKVAARNEEPQQRRKAAERKKAEQRSDVDRLIVFSQLTRLYGIQ